MKEEVKPMIPTIFIPGRQEALRSYREAIYSAGGVPICSLSAADSALCGGLLLPGGGDIGERLDEPERKLIQPLCRVDARSWASVGGCRR